MQNKLELKKELFLVCQKYVNTKITSAQEAINNAQKSANKETKSSVGDKYETGRSMMQLEIEKYSAQLNDGLNLKKILSQIDIDKSYSIVKSGSLVETTYGNFFISISAGKIIIKDIEYISISYSSPIGQALFEKKANDEVKFREKIYIIKSVT